jgi:hypothetical protein
MVVTMLAEIFMVRLEAKPRGALQENFRQALPSSCPSTRMISR